MYLWTNSDGTFTLCNSGWPETEVENNERNVIKSLVTDLKNFFVGYVDDTSTNGRFGPWKLMQCVYCYILFAICIE